MSEETELDELSLNPELPETSLTEDINFEDFIQETDDVSQEKFIKDNDEEEIEENSKSFESSVNEETSEITKIINDTTTESKKEAITTTNTAVDIISNSTTTTATPSVTSDTSPAIVSTNSNAPKIIQKLPFISSSASTKSTKYIIVKNSQGNPIKLAVPSNFGQNTGTTNKSTIQVLKLPDGRLLQIKSSNNSSNTSQSTSTNINASSSTGGQTIVKNANVVGSTQQKILLSPTSIPTNSSLGTQILKSITQGDKKIVVAQKPPNTVQLTKLNNTANTEPTVLTVPKTSSSSIVTKTPAQKIIVKEDGDTKTIFPQNIIKLSTNSVKDNVKYQTLQIAGKSGMQVVKIVSTPYGGTTTPLGGIATTPQTSTSSVVGEKKTILNSKPPPVILNRDAPTGLKQYQKQLTTYPTLKKINEHEKAFTAIIRSGNNKISNGQQNKVYVLPREFMKQLQDKKEGISNANVKKDIIAAMQSDTIKPLVTTIASSSTAGQSKQYFSILKSSNQESIANDNVVIKSEPQSILKMDNVERMIASLSIPRKKSRSESPEGEGVLKRKHCNCNKSQCLKLYCDCFANGEFCENCNCKECFNNLQNEKERTRAIRLCLERNPHAFKPKITKARDQADTRLHNKGCNCKRSGCLKNYCECYEAKITCSSNCKCIGCRNNEEHDNFNAQPPPSTLTPDMLLSRRSLQQASSTSLVNNRSTISTPPIVATKRSYSDIINAAEASFEPKNKQQYNFITEDVVDATVQCMLAQGEECRKSGINAKTSERMITEELGRCLVEIIDFSIRNME